MSDKFIDYKIRQDKLDTKLAEAAESEGCPCADCEHNGTCNGSPLCEDYVAWAEEKIKTEMPKKFDIDWLQRAVVLMRRQKTTVYDGSFAVMISREMFDKLKEQRRKIEPYEPPSKLNGIDFYVSQKLKGGQFRIGLKEVIEKEIEDENQ